MESKINVYDDEEIDGKKYRYILGKKGNKTLYFLAMNPSVATKEIFDQTVMKAFGLALLLGYDGCVVMNVLPIRESKSDKLPNTLNKITIETNIKTISTIPENSNIVACWGEKVTTHKLLKESLIKIYDCLKNKELTWYCLQDTKSGNILTGKEHPRHLSFLKETGMLKSFDIDKYMKKVNN